MTQKIKLTKKNVLIVGMARSGTSMTSAIFANDGYYVAENESKDLRKADEFNPSGYWEAAELIKCNEEIFSAVGYNQGNTWINDAITSSQAKNILDLDFFPHHKNIIEEYSKHAPWIWKDPRLCYSLGYWWPLLNADNTCVLLLKRNPLEIYNSFVRLKWRQNNKKDKLETLQRIKNHLDFAEQAIEKFNIPHICINYADFETKPVETVNAINAIFKTNIKPMDLGYNKNFNTSSFRGKIIKLIDSIGDLMPNNIRKSIKKMIPNKIWKLLNPNRYLN